MTESRCRSLPLRSQLCEHLRGVDEQTTSRSSSFLEACRAFKKGDLTEDKLVDTAARIGFANVIDAFHVVGLGPIAHSVFLG